MKSVRDGGDTQSLTGMQPLVPLVFHNLPSLYPPSFSIYSSVQFEQIIVDVRNIDMFLTLQL